VIPQDLAVFRLHEGSISGSGRLTDQYLKDLDKLFAEVYGRDRGVSDRLFTQFLRVKREVIYRLRLQ
jgi:hypothetical protein